jgi:hypothetical protein
MKQSPIQTINDPKFIERMAEIEHAHWLSIVSNLIDSGKINQDEAQEMKKNFVPYERLPDSMKEERRTWAYKVIRELSVALLADEMIPDQYGG